MSIPTRVSVLGSSSMVVIALGAIGCVTPASRPYTEDEAILYEHHCARWGENTDRLTCLQEQADRRSDCYIVCADPYTFFPGCYDQCDDLYSNDECGGADRVCLEGSEHVFTVARVPDAELGAACRMAFANMSACGQVVEGDPCATFERIERREAIDTYACVAARPCGSTTECPAPPDPEGDRIHIGLGGRVRESARAAGQTYSEDLYDYLNDVDDWLRDDVREAFTECEVHWGAERMACLNAWLDVVLP